MSLRAALVALLVSAPMAGSALAGGFGIPEIGVRRTGMASVIGRPDDGSALYHNPAGLVLQSGWNVYFSFGASFLSTEFQLSPWDNDRSSELLGEQPNADGYYAPVTPTRAFGVVPMIAASYSVLPDKLTVGAGIYVGNAQGARFADDASTRYHLIDGYIVAPQAVIGAAYRLHPTISVGATVGVLNLRLKGKREFYPSVNGSDISELTGTHPMLELEGQAWAPTWMVAAFGQPHPRITWGLTVTGRVDAELKGPVTATFDDDSTSQPGAVYEGEQTTKQLLPWAFMGGLNVDVHPNIEVGSEFRYWLYRQYKSQHTDIVGIFLLRVLETQKNYRDSWQLSGGVRVHGLGFAPALDILAGTHFDRTPAPTSTVALDQPTFNHVGAHTGVRYTVGRYRLGASYIHYWYDVPTVDDSMTMPPSNFRGEGTNNIFTVSVEAKL